MELQPFEVDLRSKQLEEVVQLLKDNGFNVSSSDDTMWESRWEPTHPLDKGTPSPPVHIIWIKDEEAKYLTVIFEQKGVETRATLVPGMDLHLFDQAPSQKSKDKEWYPIKSLNIMR